MSSSTFGKFGKGLSSLMGEQKISENPDTLIRIDPTRLVPSPYQPRTEFDPESLRELAESIKENGIIQPIVARQRGKEYEIIAGERRWRAAKMVGLNNVPVIIRELTDRDCMEMALVENIQRRDLSPLEEAQAYRRLLGEFGYTQEDLGRTVGKSRSHVANILRLLALPDSIKQMLKAHAISMGHARAILSAENPVYVAQKIIEDKLNVRETEELIQDMHAAKEERLSQAQNIQNIPAVTEEPPATEPEIMQAEVVTEEVDAMGAAEEAVAPVEAETEVIAETTSLAETAEAAEITEEVTAASETETPLASPESDEFLSRAEAIKEAEDAISRAVRNLGIDAEELAESYSQTRYKDPDISALEVRLTRHLNCNVQIKARGKSGELRIKYKNLEQLDRILQLIDQEKVAPASV